MSDRLKSEGGFTLVELLVVILIIGILAAIAIPVFTNQQRAGQDASAKSNVRNAASTMETCFAQRQTYVGCVLTGSGLPIGGAAGQVNIVGGSTTVANFSVSSLSASGCTYRINKTAAGTARVSTPPASCPGPTW